MLFKEALLLSHFCLSMSNYDTKTIPPPADAASLALGFHN